MADNNENNENELNEQDPIKNIEDTEQGSQVEESEIESAEEDSALEETLQKDTVIEEQNPSNDILTDDVYTDEEFSESRGVPKRKSNFFVEIFTKLENFSFISFKEGQEKKQEEKADKKSKKKKLDKSSTTISDVQKQRNQAVKHVGYKIGLVGLFFIFLTVAIILAFQDNEQQARPNINMEAVLNDTTSFGGIDQKDYFLEQNVLDDKINIVEKAAKKSIKKLETKVLEQTDIITKHIDSKIGELKDQQSEELSNVKESILKTVDKKIKEVSVLNESVNKKVKALSSRVEKYKNSPSLNLVNGKLSFPSSGTNTLRKINPIVSLSPPSNSVSHTNGNEIVTQEIEYETVEIDMSALVVPELTFETGLEEAPQEADEGFEFDLTTTLVRVTLINGIKAPTLDIGVKNPTPVLMSIDGVAYAANDNKDVVLRGCLLRGVAIGNINTSRAEIFGTHLSCIIEGDSGEKFKVEHTFPKNEVWIKGEDGSDGVAGLIVDSSGKILAKSAAIGFMQGLTNYFSAQNLVTGGLNSVNSTGGNQNTVAQLGTSMQSGVGTGLTTGFDLIIEKYEQILGGYYPFIDVKGGRKNLTAIFGGSVKLKATPYVKAHLENH